MYLKLCKHICSKLIAYVMKCIIVIKLYKNNEMRYKFRLVIVKNSEIVYLFIRYLNLSFTKLCNVHLFAIIYFCICNIFFNILLYIYIYTVF